MSALDMLAAVVAHAHEGARRGVPDSLLARAAASLRGVRLEVRAESLLTLEDRGGEPNARAAALPARALLATCGALGALDFPQDLTPDALARFAHALARSDGPSVVRAAAEAAGVAVVAAVGTNRAPLAAVARLEERLQGADPHGSLAPPSPSVRRALAAVLDSADDDDLLLAVCVVRSADPRVRRAVRSALVAARVARGAGHPASDTLSCALAGLAGVVPPDARAVLRRVVSPEAGTTEVARAVALLGVADPDGPHGASPLARCVAVAFASERLAGEPPRLLHADALARMRTDARLDAGTVDVLVDALGPYPPGSAWVLRDGGVGVVVDRPGGRARVRHVFDAEGRPARPGIVQPAAEAQPHAPIDLLELGVDPSAVLTG